ncbi:MAG: hypothetical protein WD009_11590 [Phycisphaeraceae bacterium]
MWLRWMPWRFVVSWFARSRGFIDPIHLLGRLRSFSQPSEVAEPVELVRAGVIFHARGLINSRAIQHNLDWIWPHWVERQFDPRDVAFVPRAFSITHVNLTHRNWTAVGQPDWDWLPIVDPAGLVTPILDRWSIDAWLLPDGGEPLFPSKEKQIDQRLELEPAVHVRTRTGDAARTLDALVQVVGPEGSGDAPVCRVQVRGWAQQGGYLAISLRPANPEGVAFIHDIAYDERDHVLRVNNDESVHLDVPPDRVLMSHYRAGDVRLLLPDGPEGQRVKCDVGLATAAVLFRVEPGEDREVTLGVPLAESAHTEPEATRPGTLVTGRRTAWSDALAGTCELAVPDERMQFHYDAAVRSLVLHAPGEVYPGPYTYRRFWFRDAAFILEAMLAAGLPERVHRCLELFPERQGPRGYFRSQEGEWDSNGAALWIMHRYCELTGRLLSDALVRAVDKGARWIENKRLADTLDAPHAGLMPAGFSAEHLGPNDFYYWDDFWSVAGLRSAAALLRSHGGDAAHAQRFEAVADRLMTAVDRSLERSAEIRRHPGIPASPYRRMDAGAIGSLAAGYPLGVWEPEDSRLLATIEFLMDNCRVRGGFFQDMIHSGINAYLTLHMAQVLLRVGDPRQVELVEAVAELASPTGQWPEAIHPHTLGGCMGDGQHIWAAAEWVLMMRSWFVREQGDALVLGQGLPAAWLEAEAGVARVARPMRLGPTPTRYGAVTVTVAPGPEGVEVTWEAAWRGRPPRVALRLAGCERGEVDGQAGRATLRRVRRGAGAGRQV